ncbi:MAG: MMPL family transporter [Planctomycetaceae bacterium]|nr:MMPL family transporter [Planctomycetaceae bacterium]
MNRPSENATPRSLPARLLGWTVATVSARPRLMLWLVLLIACAGVGITVTQLQVRTSRSDLTDQASRFAKNWQQYADTFGANSDLLVVVETPAPNAKLIRAVIDDLGARLNREPEHFENVLARVNLTAMRRKALQFLTPQEVERTASRLQTYDRVVKQQNWDLVRTETLANTLRKQIEKGQEEGVVSESTWKSLERFSSSLSSYFRNALETGKVERTAFKSPLPDLMTVAGDQKLTDGETGYILNEEGSVGVVQVCLTQKPAKGVTGPDAVTRLKELLAEVQKLNKPDNSDLKLSLTGIPALEHDEMRSTSIDMKNAGIVAFFVVGGLLLLVFRGVRHPMLALLTLIVSVCWTFGAATLVVGHLNIVSVCFAIFLVGLSIDFSVSFTNRYLALRQELYELPDALREAAETTGTGILTSAITTALAFSTALLTGFPGLAELGVISAIGVLLCAAATFLFLPALIALSDASVEVEKLPQPFSPALLRRVLVAWPSVSIGLTCVLLAFFAWKAFSYSDGSIECKVAYNPNLLRLQDPNAESVLAERRLEQSGTDTVLHAVAIASSWEEAIALREKFLSLPTVARVSDAASKLPDQANPQTAARLQALQQQAASVSPTLPQLTSESNKAVGSEVDRLFMLVRNSKHPVAQQSARQLDQFLDDLSSTPGGKATAILSAYNNMVARWLLLEYNDIAKADRFDPVSLKDLPRELKTRYLRVDANNQQQWALRIYPKNDVWDGAALQSFISDLRTVDPHVTGPPVQILESAGRMNTTYANVGLYALAVISLVLLFNYLRPGQKLMTIVPPVGVAAFIGYTLFQRNGTVDPSLLVMICLGLVTFIAAVLDYKNLRDTILTLVPAMAGGLMTLGVLALLKLELNPMNLIALPLVFAIGIDNGIYLVSDCRKQISSGKDGYEPSADTLSSVLVTSLTSIAGFGSLMIASHNGMFSIGLLLAIGVASSLLVSLALMPPVLALVARYSPAEMEPVRILRRDDAEGADGAAKEAPKAQPQQKKKAA